MFGLGAGAFCCSWLPDKLGRRITLLATGLVLTPVHFALIYTNNYTIKLVGFGLIGFLYIGKTVTLNLMYELTEKKYTGCICYAFTALDWSSYGIIAFLLSVQREVLPALSFYVYLGALALCLELLFVPESPKFLLLNGRKEEAVASLNYIARVNRSPHRFSLADKFLEEEVGKVTSDQEHAANSEKNY